MRGRKAQAQTQRGLLPAGGDALPSDRQPWGVALSEPAFSSMGSFSCRQNWNERVCVSVRESVCVQVYMPVGYYVCMCVNVSMLGSDCKCVSVC